MGESLPQQPSSPLGLDAGKKPVIVKTPDDMLFNLAREKNSNGEFSGTDSSSEA